MSTTVQEATPPQESYAHGAWRRADGSVAWRVWAPTCERVVLVTFPNGRREETTMTPAEFGFHTHQAQNVPDGLPYLFKLSERQEYPDPASRWQPAGVHKPSAVFSPHNFAWTDQQWRGVAREDLVIYELHVGTFTPAGAFAAVIPRLPELAALGVTALEIMPIAQFSGTRNWGYDGVHPYAAQNSYGGPQAFQQLVDAAHTAGLAVLLDVVYNHVGPEGNYLGQFGPYFTDRHHTPWGKAVNYDGPDSDPVRQFVTDNARMWVRDFHVDGLRLDAVQTIFDSSPVHILADIQSVVQAEAAQQQRRAHVIAETNQNDVRLVRSPQVGGYGLDGIWSDDFHHSVHALLTGEREGYYMDFGRPEELVKTYNDVFAYDGGYSCFRRRRHGSPVGKLDRTHFVFCIQNHDQIGNRAEGGRLANFLPPAAQRLACGLLLISPCTPLLFMGEEYGERHPFPFFCSFRDPALIEAVRRGRREEFAALAFKWGVDVPDPQAPETFAAAQLTWSWPAGSHEAQLRQLYGDLLAARRQWPALRNRRQTAARLVQVPLAGSAAAHNVLVVERGGVEGIVAVANLSAETIPLAGLGLLPGPILLSTEAAGYGGRRPAQPSPHLYPFELLVSARKTDA